MSRNWNDLLGGRYICLCGFIDGPACGLYCLWSDGSFSHHNQHTAKYIDGVFHDDSPSKAMIEYVENVFAPTSYDELKEDNPFDTQANVTTDPLIEYMGFEIIEELPVLPDSCVTVLC